MQLWTTLQAILPAPLNPGFLLCMHILACTDIHGAYDTVIDILTAEPGVDVLIIGGDLTTHGTPEEATRAIGQFQQFGIPVLAVAGNMDLPSFEHAYDTLGVNISGRGIVIENVGFFGVAGSPLTPMHTPYEIPEALIRERAESGWRDVQSSRWKVFVPHAPPLGTSLDRIFSGRHVGSRAVREFVDQSQPDVLLCGHIHEARGVNQLGNTRMVNCGSAARGFFASVEIVDSVTINLREHRPKQRNP